MFSDPTKAMDSREIARLQRELAQHAWFRPGCPGHSLPQKKLARIKVLEYYWFVGRTPRSTINHGAPT